MPALRWTFVVALLLGALGVASRATWNCAVFDAGSRVATFVGIDRAPLWDPPAAPLPKRTDPEDVRRGERVVEVSWRAFWFDLLPAIGAMCLVFGFVYASVRRARIDTLLHMALPAGLGVVAAAVTTMGLWMVGGGWGPPFAVELGAIGAIGGAVFGVLRARRSRPDSMMESPLLTEIRRAFAGLLEQRVLAIRSSAFYPKQFGDSTVVLDGKGMQLGVATDRGELYADVRGGGRATWYGLRRVLIAAGITAPGVTDVEGRELALDEIALLMEEHLGKIEAAFEPARLAETRRRLGELEEEERRLAQQRWGRPKSES